MNQILRYHCSKHLYEEYFLNTGKNFLIYVLLSSLLKTKLKINEEIGAGER